MILTIYFPDIMMSGMRTTLTLDSDVAHKLKELVHLRRSTFKDVVNDVLRRGLSGGTSSSVDPEFRVVPHHGGFRPGIDLDKLNQWVDEDEVADFVNELRGEGE